MACSLCWAWCEAATLIQAMVRGGDLDPGELFGGGAELVHVAHGGHRVHVDDGGSIDGFEADIRGIAVGAGGGAGGHAFGARPPGEGDEAYGGLAGGDGLRGMADVQHVGRAAGLGAVHVAHVAQAHVFNHRQCAEPGCVAGAEVAVHIVDAKARIGQRPARALRMDLRHRLVRRLACGVLVDARDIGFAPDAHR